MESEEVYWSQRSRAQWLHHGDKNTKFFHQKAYQKLERNLINIILDKNGFLLTKKQEIGRIFNEFFQELFSSSNPSRIAEATAVVSNRINDDRMRILDRHFTGEEVLSVLKQMKSSAAPSPDGMPAMFYQHFWEIVGPDVTKLALDILNGEASRVILTKLSYVLFLKLKGEEPR